MYIFIISFVFILGPVACKSRTFSKGNNESKPTVTPPKYIPPETDSSNPIVFHGIYDVVIRSRANNDVKCRGEVSIVAYLHNEVINGTVPCDKALGVKEIEIGDGILQEKVRVDFPEMEKLKLDKRVRRITRKGNIEFRPYRPDIIGPLIQDVSTYRDIDFKETFTVHFPTDNPLKAAEVSSGTMHVKVLETKGSYKPQNFPETFNNVLRYQMNSTGFEELSDKSAADIYEVYEYRWNTQPMRLLNIRIEGPVKDFEKSRFKGWIGNLVSFPGGISINMDLRELVEIPDTYIR